MGNGFSIENDVCGLDSMDNAHIVYVLRQYITITKAIVVCDDLISFIDNNKDAVKDVTPYLFPLDAILRDYIQKKPLETSKTIFGENQELRYNYQEKKQVLSYHTVLDQYNEYLAVSYTNDKSTTDKKNALTGIRTDLIEAQKRAIKILDSSCNYRGKNFGTKNPPPSKEPPTLPTRP
jgi:hypothetical protein